MDRLLYVGMTGAKAAMQKQDRIAQNLANVNTPGYKSISSQTMAVHTNSDTRNSRAYAVETSTVTDNTSGALLKTDNPFNVAIDGAGWFSVFDGKKEAYTRNGNFHLDQTGTLVTDKGYPVLSSGGNINIPVGGSIEVAQDGSVSAILPNGNSVLVDRLKIVTSDSMSHSDNGLFYTANAQELETPKTLSGYLESSNVNSATELVHMISASRLFDMQMKTIQFAKENDEVANKIIQL